MHMASLNSPNMVSRCCQWVPVDPTFGQFPADATHVKVVEGDLDKQIAIMGLLGKIKLALIDVQ